MTKKHLSQRLSYLTLLFLLLSFFILPVRSLKAQNEVKPGEIVINEIMWMGSSISTADEWIELRNLTDHEIDISNWTIEGAASKQGTLTIPLNQKIGPGSYFLISNYPKDKSKIDIDPDLTTTSISLSNSNLKLVLKTPNHLIVDQAGDGTKPLAGDNTAKASMERNDPPGDGTKKDNWHTATTSVNFDPGSSEKGTPKAQNSPPSTQPQEQSPTLPEITLPKIEPEGGEVIALSTIKEARQKKKDSQVLVEGIVSVSPGTFSSHYFYLQDETGGIQIYSSKNFPSLSIGQKVRVLGTLSEAYNEKRIKISQSQDISNVGQFKEPEPIFLKLSQINEDYEGMLIKTKGKVVEPKGNLFYLDDGSGKIKIYIKKETKIEKPKLKEGEELEITGIVSQYKESYRILPRKNEDLKTATGEVLKTALSKKKGEMAEEEEIEEVTGEPEEGKVLGVMAKRVNQTPWLSLVILGGLGLLGYLGYDYYNQKRKGDSKIWSKIGQIFKRR